MWWWSWLLTAVGVLGDQFGDAAERLPGSTS
jgi:hypothetical protein